MLIIKIIKVSFMLTGLVLIIIGHRYRVPEHKSFWEGLPFPKFSPLSPVGLRERKQWWRPPGYKIHVVGLCFFSIGIITNVLYVILRLYT